MTKTFDEKIDDATHAAMSAVGLSPERRPDTADMINNFLSDILSELVTGDDEETDMTDQIKARPGINGNTPEDFERSARVLFDAAGEMRTALNSVTAEALHGRNYQHFTDPAEAQRARRADLHRAHEIAKALDDATRIAGDLMMNAKGD